MVKKKVKLIKGELINFVNALFSIQEPPEDKFTAEFKFCILKNQRIAGEETKIITEVLKGKLADMKKERDEIDIEYCQLIEGKEERKLENLKHSKDKNGDPLFNIFFGCIRWPSFEAISELEEKYNHELKALLEKNDKLIEELKTFMKEKIEVEISIISVKDFSS